jgi:Xaa-Pro dipeptidase
MLESLGCRGKRLGIESQSYGLTHFNGKAVDAALSGFCKLSEANDLVNTLRLVKSPAELRYVRKAGQLGDVALTAAVRKTKAGADEGDILAAQQGAIFTGGGDYPANEFIIGSGRDALLCRYKSGRRKLAKRDQLTLEWAGVYRHYHAAFMRTFIIGKPGKQHLAMDEAARAALAEVETVLRPGYTAGEVFAAHARVMDDHGMKDHRLNACGYSLGAKFTPSWMDSPMFYKGNPAVIGTGMVFFAHMILMNSSSGHAFCLGRTYIIGEKRAEPVSKVALGMIVR